MEKLLHVSSSPHVRARVKTSNLMFLVVLALLPAACAGIWVFGPYAAAVMAVSVASAVLTEGLYEKLVHRPVTVKDGSAVVTGLLLGMNLPVSVPLWMPVLGSVFAILVVKQLFGGLGQNFMNPAPGREMFPADLLRGTDDGFFPQPRRRFPDRGYRIRSHASGGAESRRDRGSAEHVPGQHQGDHRRDFGSGDPHRRHFSGCHGRDPSLDPPAVSGQFFRLYPAAGRAAALILPSWRRSCWAAA